MCINYALNMPKTKTPQKRASAPVDENPNVRTTIGIPKTVQAAGKALAKAERRSFSAMLATLIEKEAGVEDGPTATTVK